mmetsp:Transcript_23081/g.49145  ORF Transcript_23081/g.49145 Transcript_23081/m.49145 type:complete len:282 (-) Transcript_23081:541-1386(-)
MVLGRGGSLLPAACQWQWQWQCHPDDSRRRRRREHQGVDRSAPAATRGIRSDLGGSSFREGIVRKRNGRCYDHAENGCATESVRTDGGSPRIKQKILQPKHVVSACCNHSRVSYCEVILFLISLSMDQMTTVFHRNSRRKRLNYSQYRRQFEYELTRVDLVSVHEHHSRINLSRPTGSKNSLIHFSHSNWSTPRRIIFVPKPFIRSSHHEAKNKISKHLSVSKEGIYSFSTALASFNNSFNSPESCMSDTMSVPPMNSPLMYNCGMVGHAANCLTPSRMDG